MCQPGINQKQSTFPPFRWFKEEGLLPHSRAGMRLVSVLDLDCVLHPGSKPKDQGPVGPKIHTKRGLVIFTCGLEALDPAHCRISKETDVCISLNDVNASDWTVKSQTALNGQIMTWGVPRGSGILAASSVSHILQMCCHDTAPFFERRLVEPRRIELLTS